MGFQVYTFSTYDLCHFRLHTDIQTHRQLLTSYTISSATQGQLSRPSLRGRLMSTSFGWEGKGRYGSLIFASLVRHSLLHFHLSHMAVHHHLLHHLHDHHLHFLLLVQSFTLNLRLGSSANHLLHRPFPSLPD